MLLQAMNSGQRRMGYILALGCSLFIVFLRCEAQNLVPNPSFELIDTCPYAAGFQPGDRPLNWYSWNNNPDYFNACAGDLGGVDTLMDVPQNGMGFQYAFDGAAYVGFYAYGLSESYHEYVGCELNAALTAGQTYYLSFRTNLAMAGTYWNPSWACNNVGLLFTMQSNSWTGIVGPPFAFRNYAHLFDPDVNTDSSGWTLVSGMFVADSAYEHLVIGNFFEDALTDTVHMSEFASLGAYYFVDSVRVCSTPDCSTATGIGLGRTEIITSGPNPCDGSFRVTMMDGRQFRWELFGIAGRIVAGGHSSGDSISIPMADYPQGQYVLRLRGERGTKQIKFIVMH